MIDFAGELKKLEPATPQIDFTAELSPQQIDFGRELQGYHGLSAAAQRQAQIPEPVQWRGRTIMLPHWQAVLLRGAIGTPEETYQQLAAPSRPENVLRTLGNISLVAPLASRLLPRAVTPVAEATVARTAAVGPTPALSRATEPPPLLSMEGQPITRAQPLTAAQEAATQTTQAVTPQEVIAAQQPGETFAQTHQRLITERSGLPIGGLEPGGVAPGATPVERVLNAIKAAKPVRAEQEALYTAERGRRLAAISDIGAREQTMAGTYQQLGALKGPLPKPQFTPLPISESDQNALVGMIEQSPYLTGYSRFNTRVALGKLFGAYGGQVPTDSELALLDRVFGTSFTRTLLAKRPVVMDWVSQTGGLAKSLSASFDLSAPLRQGAYLAPRFHQEFQGAFKDMFRYALREDAYQGIKDYIASAPEFEMAERAKLAMTALSDTALTTGEESFVASQWAEKIPGVRFSNRAYNGFLTKFRFDVFKSIIRDAQTLGVELTDDRLAQIGNFINAGTGRGNLGQLAPAANALATVLFSPRLLASRLQLLNPVYYIRMDPFVRKYALQSAAAFYGTAASILGIAALAGARVNTDWQHPSADLGKIRIGNTRYEITGGFQAYFRLAAQLFSGQAYSSITNRPITDRGKPITRYEIVKRFAEGKFAPLLSSAKEILTGETFGQPISVQQQIYNRFVPLIIQDAVDLYQQGGPEAVPKILPGVFGVGVQTYGPPQPPSYVP